MNPDLARRLIGEAIDLRCFSSVGFTGGEPLLRLGLVTELGAMLTQAGIRWGLTTGGGWARTLAVAERYAQSLLIAGINHITVSVDPSHLLHLEGKQPKAFEHFIRILVEGDVQVTISVTRYDEKEVVPIDIPSSKNLRIEYHYVAPVGNASGTCSGATAQFSLMQSRCPMNEGLTISVWPNGLVYPCCSTYVVNKDEELAIGDATVTSLEDLLIGALQDPYLCAIREIGFAGVVCLTDELDVWKEIFNQPLQDQCHLCSRIARKPGAIFQLRRSLSLAIK